MPTETTLAVHNEVEIKAIINAYRDLLRSINVKRKRKDTELIRKAYEIAVVGHQEQRRKSGEPYILHPIAVAKICAEEIGLGFTSVMAALLHDRIVDTNVNCRLYTYEASEEESLT